jgi:hypothetical protein
LSQTKHNTKIRTNPHKSSQHFRGSKTHRNTNKNTKNKNEIKFLYKKKQYLNKELYNLHIQNANEWGNIWNIITNDITNTINNTMKHKYIKITKKLHKLRTEEEKDTQHITMYIFPLEDGRKTETCSGY